MPFSIESRSYSDFSALVCAGVIRQVTQVWSKDKNYNYCFDLDYEAETDGPGYIWITRNQNTSTTCRMRADFEFGDVLKYIFDTVRPVRALKAGFVRDCYFTGRTVTDANFQIRGVPFLKVKLSDLSRRQAFQVEVDI